MKNQVKALEKIKNKWQEVIDQQEYAENVTALTEDINTIDSPLTTADRHIHIKN